MESHTQNREEDRKGTKGVVRIMLVDDSEPFLKAARRSLALEPGIEVVGVARSGEEAIGLAERVVPDLAFVDMSMPRLNGLDTARALVELDPAPRVVILTAHDASAYEEAARRNGAAAVMAKWGLQEEAPGMIRELFPDRFHE